MGENEHTGSADEDLAPTDQDAGEPTEEHPQAAPTDYRRNIWLLVIIIVVVVSALVVTLLWKVRVPEEIQALRQPAALPVAAAPLSPARAPRPRPAPVIVSRIIGSDAEVIVASPPLSLPTTGMRYRLGRFFDVTNRVPDFDLKLFVRLPRRWADQGPNLVVSELEEPAFQPAQSVAALMPQERVVVLSSGGQSRVYPVRTLSAYVALYDSIGETPVFLCWNRFTQTARCLAVQLDEREVQWCDAGLLYRGNNVYYDTETGSLWDPFSGTALTGPSAGKSAQAVPVTVWLWEDCRAQHPEALVLTADLEVIGAEQGPTPAAMDVFDPYLESPLIPLELEHFKADATPLPAKTFVLGVASQGQARAYPLAQLSAEGVTTITDSVGGRDLEVHVTSSRTAYATSAGELTDALVMLWFAWVELHPESDVYEAPAPGSVAAPTDASATGGQ